MSKELPGGWKIADGWAEQSEALDHKAKLQRAHPNVTFAIRHSNKAFGGGKWLVVYRHKD